MVIGVGFVGGLVGQNRSPSYNDNYRGTTTASYAGGSGTVRSAYFRRVLGKTETELKMPTGYTGIYAYWDADIDNV